MKKLFHIRNEGTGPVLALRIGERHFSFLVTDQDAREIIELGWCQVEPGSEPELNECLRSFPVLTHEFQRTEVSFDFPQSVFIPSSWQGRTGMEEILELTNGKLYGSHTVTESVPGWAIQNMFSVFRYVDDWVRQRFPSASVHQLNSVGLKQLINVDAGCLLVDFRIEDFTLLAGKSAELQLANTFTYSSPEDVIYHLLSICQVFSFEQDKVHLRISGLIDINSTLFRELCFYFENIELRAAFGSSNGDHPIHFFTSLKDLALCGS